MAHKSKIFGSTTFASVFLNQRNMFIFMSMYLYVLCYCLLSIIFTYKFVHSSYIICKLIKTLKNGTRE